MWPFIAFAVLVVLVLVWLDKRVGPLPKTLQYWSKSLPCGCVEWGFVRYQRFSANLIWARTYVRIRPKQEQGRSQLRKSVRCGSGSCVFSWPGADIIRTRKVAGSIRPPQPWTTRG
jgi:hypothetical protein